MKDQTPQAAGSHPDNHPLFAPGLRRIRDGAFYWIPPKKDVQAGYAPKSIRLEPGLNEFEIAERCRALWAGLVDWRKGNRESHARHSIAWLIDRYQRDTYSPYQALGHRARRSYNALCKTIRETIGERRIDPKLEGGAWRARIVGEDVRRWHSKWGYADENGKLTAPSRARHLIAMLRALASYAVEIDVPGANDLRNLMRAMRFPTTPARDVAPTREQVLSLVTRAIEQGDVSFSIATLAQFELTERRTHIIGAWDGGQWRPGWVWQGVSKEWVITYAQTKVGRVVRQFDLKATPLLLELLQRTPEEKRVGPVIVCERTGKPWKERHFGEVFRKTARAVGLPDEICSMDMRAGGATEAASIPGLTQMDLQAAGGWKDPKMAARYTRDASGRANRVVALRQKAREK